MTGRIGELYAALISGGQMAPETNQRGYDVVSSNGERISVKTTTRHKSTGTIQFTESTISEVDRIMILYLNIEEMQIDTVIDESIENLQDYFSPSAEGKVSLAIGKLSSNSHKVKPIENQTVIKEAKHNQYLIKEYESGTIIVLNGDIQEINTKKALRKISKELKLSQLNSNGNPYNTRQLGAHVIKELTSR